MCVDKSQGWFSVSARVCLTHRCLFRLDDDMYHISSNVSPTFPRRGHDCTEPTESDSNLPLGTLDVDIWVTPLGDCIFKRFLWSKVALLTSNHGTASKTRSTFSLRRVRDETQKVTHIIPGWLEIADKCRGLSYLFFIFWILLGLLLAGKTATRKNQFH